MFVCWHAGCLRIFLLAGLLGGEVGRERPSMGVYVLVGGIV